MEFFSDLFLGGAAIAAAIYCLVLSRKITKLTGLDQDLGGAIAVLSQQVDEMTRALDQAKSVSDESGEELAELAKRADAASARLELLLASLDASSTAPKPTASTSVDSGELLFRHQGVVDGGRTPS